jgi:hypothetical protein
MKHFLIPSTVLRTFYITPEVTRVADHNPVELSAVDVLDTQFIKGLLLVEHSRKVYADLET